VLPETHEPDLARALNNLAECLSDLDRSKEAAAAIEEATRVLSPFFLAYPTAFQVLMKEVVSHYSQYLQQAGRAPDLELLAPIQASLAGMERSR
ncbi:MAG TPA: hypothetical protein VMW27_18505, partial [Thermoanaerobaculia bacterium]|nr:hypothetical protein [Thermoanaerobaculia bacterium]